MKYSELNTRKKVILTLINRNTPRAYNNCNCVYDQDFSGGCAIGCLITKSKSKNLPEDGDLSQIFSLLPKRLQNLGSDFLQNMLNVHDRPENWIDERNASKKNGYVWSNVGRIKINYIIDKYKIKLQHIRLHEYETE